METTEQDCKSLARILWRRSPKVRGETCVLPYNLCQSVKYIDLFYNLSSLPQLSLSLN